MLNRLPILVFGLVLSFLFFVSSASAQTPRRYYDWGSTLETRSNKVLGIDSSSSASSSSKQSSSPQSYEKFDRYLFGSNLTTDDPFYFVKTFQENIQLTVNLDPIKKEEMRLSIAGEKLGEIQQLVGINKFQALARTTVAYGQIMEAAAQETKELKNQKNDVDSLIKKIEAETAKHTVVLEKVAVEVPSQAKESLNRALEASYKGTDMAADLSGRPAVPADVVDRLQSLKAQGLLTEEETSKLISTKTRVEAREEIQKYVNEGVIPEADFLRLSENVKEMYPNDFFQLHEVKRFFELQKLETEKPDGVTLQKIQDFAKTYKPGDVVPADIRRYWVPVIRLEEIQNTLRPDLIDVSLIQGNKDGYKKFNEVVERFKPRPEDLAYLNNYLSQNSQAQLPPEYERMKNLAEKYGAQCGDGMKWFTLSSGIGGYCAPESMGNNVQLSAIQTGSGKSCKSVMTSAKNSNGVCMVMFSDCLPSGWYKVSSCNEAMGSTGLSGSQANRTLSCPSNSHFIPVSYIPDGGYCIPNYTPVSQITSTGMVEMSCQTGYHRNYPGGPCLQDYGNTNTFFSLPPLTSTPGNYPNPMYPSSGQCGSNYRWVSDSFNPVGGYCTPNYTSGSGSTTSSSGSTPGSCSTTWVCPSGMSWNNSSCDCRTPSGSVTPPVGSTWNSGGSASTCQPPSNGCGGSSYWDYASCVCRANSSYPSACSYPSGGCGTGRYWDSSSCSCKYTSTTSGSTTPSGYGTCSSGQYWNGSTCVTTTTTSGSTMSRDQQEATCKAGGGTCSWNGDTCNCQGYKTPSTTTTTTSTTTTTTTSNSTGMSREQQQAGCTSCGGTCNWNGDTCQCQCDSSSSNTSPTSASAPTSVPQQSEPAPTSAPAPTTAP